MAKTAKSHSAETTQVELPPLLPADRHSLSKKAHEGQKRSSGEDYITHPVSVACIAARFHLDAASIQAALLHDVVEDTNVSLESIAKQFTPQVAKLVEGLSKLDKIHFDDASHAQA
jgi:GTP diphosphokinase / guanosine-3',5'-bis(diphosphate) 3'-diphosphatase